MIDLSSAKIAALRNARKTGDRDTETAPEAEKAGEGTSHMNHDEDETDIDDQLENEESETDEEDTELDDENGDDEPENQDDDDGNGDEDEDDSEEDEDDADLGKGAQKRIRQLNERMKAAERRAKDLERERDEARKLSGDDGRALLAAAESSGILPGLMTKDEARAFQDLAEIPQVIERYQDWLDDNDNDAELDIGNGSAMSYGDVKKRVRKLRAQLEDLKDRYGERRKELTAKVRGIFETGLAAMKAGWKPGGEKKPKKNERKKLHDKPAGKKKPTAKSGKKANWGDVDGEDSFVRAIAASNKE